jgi:hypothetical protein
MSIALLSCLRWKVDDLRTKQTMLRPDLPFTVSGAPAAVL